MIEVKKYRTKDNIQKQLEDYLSEHQDMFIQSLTTVEEEGDEAVVVVYNDDPGYKNTMVMEENGVGINLEQIGS